MAILQTELICRRVPLSKLVYSHQNLPKTLNVLSMFVVFRCNEQISPKPTDLPDPPTDPPTGLDPVTWGGAARPAARTRAGGGYAGGGTPPPVTHSSTRANLRGCDMLVSCWTMSRVGSSRMGWGRPPGLPNSGGWGERGGRALRPPSPQTLL